MFKKIVAATAITGGLVLAGAGAASADAGSAVTGNAGFLNGIVVQAPISVPANACGLSVPIVAAVNPVDGNVCMVG